MTEAKVALHVKEMQSEGKENGCITTNTSTTSAINIDGRALTLENAYFGRIEHEVI